MYSRRRPRGRSTGVRNKKAADAKRTRGSNSNSQCQVPGGEPGGANCNANTKVHKLANLRISGRKAKQTEPNKADGIPAKERRAESSKVSLGGIWSSVLPSCRPPHKYKCFLVWNRHKKPVEKEKSKENTKADTGY